MKEDTIMAKLPAYFTLCEKVDGKWCPQFGDYEKAVVKDELADWLDSGYSEFNLVIVKSEDSQVSIDRAVAFLNGSEL